MKDSITIVTTQERSKILILKLVFIADQIYLTINIYPAAATHINLSLTFH